VRHSRISFARQRAAPAILPGNSTYFLLDRLMKAGVQIDPKRFWQPLNPEK
jgi:hypothetical protein